MNKSEILQKELEELKQKIKEKDEIILNKDKEINDLKEHLKKYTAPERRRIYYKKNREKELNKVKEYQKKTNYILNRKPVDPEKKKKYNKKAYLKKKDKLDLNNNFETEQKA